MTSRRLLQGMIAALGLVPLGTGMAGVVMGPAFVMPDASWPTDLDSHFRYLSGLFFAVGLAFYACIRHIERRTALFRLAAALVVAGGLGRLLSLVAVGAPSVGHLAGLTLELAVVPMLVVWQGRVARRAHADGTAETAR